MRSPDDSPNLTDPTTRPSEPVTAGLATGPGAGPEALGVQSYSQQRAQDIATIKQYLPLFDAATKFDGAPDTFKSLVNYLKTL